MLGLFSMTCFSLLARLGVQPRGGFSLYPWYPNACGLWESQGSFELHVLVCFTWCKVGSVDVQLLLSHFCPWPFLGGAVWVWVWWLVFVGRVED